MSPPAAGPAAGLLAVDIGAGTTDVLLTRPGEPLENAVKMVLPSAAQVVAARLRAATARRQTVVLRGPVMGGGACAAALRAHLQAGLPALATASAALTFADDLDRVRAWGVEVVGDDEAATAIARGGDGVAAVATGDLDLPRLLRALGELGVDARPDVVAVAAQDHGFSPAGSNRAVRFRFWRQAVRDRLPLTSLVYSGASVPAAFTRLRALADAAALAVPRRRVLVADTGTAALLGAATAPGHDEPELDEARPAHGLAVNLGNGHTVAALAWEDGLAGVFEHHTRLLDRERLEGYLRRWLAGELDDEAVRDEGGHGAVVDRAVAALVPADLPWRVTGPRRALLRGSRLPVTFTAPWGDVMLGGCFGLLVAARRLGLTAAGEGGHDTQATAG